MKHKLPNIPSHDHLKGDDRTWRWILTAGVLRGMGAMAAYE